MNLLVAGFAPWDHCTSNPSGELALELGGVMLPVDWTRSWAALSRALHARRPEALLLLGLAERRPEPAIERFALNLDYVAQGPRKRDRKIEPDGPWIREGRLPWDRILAAWERAGIAGVRSHHAGTFLCNHVYYRALGAFDGPCGFIHLPPFRTVGRRRQRKALDLVIAAVRAATR